jgi:hypothetical protein
MMLWNAWEIWKWGLSLSFWSVGRMMVASIHLISIHVAGNSYCTIGLTKVTEKLHETWSRTFLLLHDKDSSPQQGSCRTFQYSYLPINPKIGIMWFLFFSNNKELSLHSSIFKPWNILDGYKQELAARPYTD